MKLMDLPVKTKLELRFDYNNKNYGMEVELQMKVTNYIFIQAICCNGEPMDKMDIHNPVLIYKTEAGLYLFMKASYKLVVFKGANMYAVSSQYDAEKLNRRETYRVYINEPVMLKITKYNGTTVTLSGILKDISLTGMGIILSYEGKDIHTIKIRLEMGKNSSIPLNGEIVSLKKLPNNKGFLYGCRFQTQKEVLSRYIVNRQIYNRINH